MNDSHTHAQLHQSGRGELLLNLAEMTSKVPDAYAAHRRLAESCDMTDQDLMYQLGILSDAGLVISSGRASGGWRPTPEGTRIAAGLRASLESGQLRFEHIMRAILENLKAAGGDATRDEWSNWDLHEEGRTPVTLDEREQALDLLEETKYTKSFNGLQASHLRVQITSRGRAALMHPDVLLTSDLFDRTQATNIDQRVGIQTHTFNNVGGAVQTGDRNTQNTTITNVQFERIGEGIAATRDALARADLDEHVRREVSAVVDELEAAAGQKAEAGVLHALITKAMMAAAGAAGGAAGGAVIQCLAAIGAAIV